MHRRRNSKERGLCLCAKLPDKSNNFIKLSPPIDGTIKDVVSYRYWKIIYIFKIIGLNHLKPLSPEEHRSSFNVTILYSSQASMSLLKKLHYLLL